MYLFEQFGYGREYHKTPKTQQHSNPKTLIIEYDVRKFYKTQKPE